MLRLLCQVQVAWSPACSGETGLQTSPPVADSYVLSPTGRDHGTRVKDPPRLQARLHVQGSARGSRDAGQQLRTMQVPGACRHSRQCSLAHFDSRGMVLHAR